MTDAASNDANSPHGTIYRFNESISRRTRPAFDHYSMYDVAGINKEIWPRESDVRADRVGRGSGPRTPPAYAPAPYAPPPPRFFQPRLHPRQPPPQYCFDAARFACDASKPRYLDVERERLVTRWLAEANEALVRRDRPPRYKPRSSDRGYSERRSDNFVLTRRNGSVEPEEEEKGDEGNMTLKEFVDKFSLPRVVKFETDDRPVLLYRVLEAHRRVEAVPLSGKKGKLVGKPLYIPDTYDGESPS
ncbi:hypothetical protein EVAR_58515_1 [Eumeta japonica]|uniref:Uncharacterized protein n=1 Tax=Eumeta variegata TaxID=151549 RepID=A0A4C1YXH2_EUMVA|nr:hypothetical protein EVAR_58515_1 [Eumeta japonica]